MAIELVERGNLGKIKRVEKLNPNTRLFLGFKGFFGKEQIVTVVNDYEVIFTEGVQRIDHFDHDDIVLETDRINAFKLKGRRTTLFRRGIEIRFNP